MTQEQLAATNDSEAPMTSAKWEEKLFGVGDWRPAPDVSPPPAPKVKLIFDQGQVPS